jgi:response regulator RpfG family c-di-GMP phosphodiesterase
MWKPRPYPYAKVLIANPSSFERRMAREFLMMMKITSIFETDDNRELAEAFWTTEFHLVVLDCDLDPQAASEIIDILRAADSLAPYIDRVMVTVPYANMRTIRIAQALKIDVMVVKPFSIKTFCSHAEVILQKTASNLGQIKPVMPRRKRPTELEEAKDIIALDA